MLDILVLNINDYKKEYLLSNVSERRVEKANRFKFEVDTLRSLTVEYALNELLKKNYPDIKTPVEVFYDENGKPYIKDCEQNISLSHSGDYAVAMICDKPCGVDIEKSTRDLSRIAKRFFMEEEKTREFSNDELLDTWTRKESILKATGKGLSLGMDTFNVSGELCQVLGKEYILKTLEAPEGYSLSYAVEK